MALPIAATPRLRGKEAERFQKKAVSNSKCKLPKKEVEKSAKIFIDCVKNQKGIKVLF